MNVNADECERSNANWDRSKIDLNECEHFLKANWDPSQIDTTLIDLSVNAPWNRFETLAVKYPHADNLKSSWEYLHVHLNWMKWTHAPFPVYLDRDLTDLYSNSCQYTIF